MHQRHLAPETPAVLLYTSGTTGFPKGAVLSHGNVVSNVEACVHTLPITPQDRVLLAVPIFHNFGQNAAFNPALAAGATVVLD